MKPLENTRPGRPRSPGIRTVEKQLKPRGLYEEDALDWEGWQLELGIKVNTIHNPQQSNVD